MAVLLHHAPVSAVLATLRAYRNADGGTGTKNILGIATTVQCVAPTVEYAAQRIRAEILPRFPNVDGVVAITHSYGCGVAIDAPGASVPIRTLKHIGLHANLAGQPLLVSLGCEKLQPARLFGSDLPGSFSILGEGNVIARFSPMVVPEAPELVDSIEKALAG